MFVFKRTKRHSWEIQMSLIFFQKRGNNYNNMGLFVCKMYIISSCDRADGCKYSKCRVTLHTIRAFFCL